MAHIYAMYLLARFREPKAYPLIVQFFSHHGDIVLEVAESVATGDLCRILASVSHGDISLITSLSGMGDTDTPPSTASRIARLPISG